MALPEQGRGDFENLPASPLTAGLNRHFRDVTSCMHEFDIKAERAAFLPVPADQLITRLKEGGHGAPIVYEGVRTNGKPFRKIGGYILSLDGASLVFFNNGQVLRGVKNNAPEFTQSEYETEFHKKETIKPVEEINFDNDGILTDQAVRDTVLFLRVQGMEFTHSNDNPDQRAGLKQMVTQRLRLVDVIEDRTLPDVYRVRDVILGYVEADRTAVHEFDLFVQGLNPADFLPPDEDTTNR